MFLMEIPLLSSWVCKYISLHDTQLLFSIASLPSHASHGDSPFIQLGAVTGFLQASAQMPPEAYIAMKPYNLTLDDAHVTQQKHTRSIFFMDV